MYVGVSPFLSVLFFEVTQNIFVYLLFSFLAVSQQPFPITCLHFVKSFQRSCQSILLLPYGLPSAYREFVNSPFALFTDLKSTPVFFVRLHVFYKISALLWEGIIAFTTLLSIFLFCRIPAALLSTPADPFYLCIGFSPCLKK